MPDQRAWRVHPFRLYCFWRTGLSGLLSTPTKFIPTSPSEEVMLTRQQATERILEAKNAKNLTWDAIAQAVGRHKVWVTAALLGQATMSKEEAGRAREVLGLGADVAAALQQFPLKGSLDATVPVDPLIYRFHEITQV